MRRAALVYVVVLAGMAAYMPFLSLYYKSLGIPIGAIGALLALSWAAGFVSGPAWGAIHDRFPRSSVLLALAGVMAGASGLGMWAVGGSPLLAVFACSFSVGLSGLTPMVDVRVLSLAGTDQTRYGLVRAFGSASFIIVAPLVGMLTDTRGPAVIFAIVVPAVVVGGFVAATVPGRSDVARTPSMLRAPGRVLRERTILLFLVGAMLCWTAINAQQGLFSIYLQDLGAPTDLVGWAWAIQGALEVPAMLAFPLLARRFGLQRLIIAGAAIALLRVVANATFTTPSLLLACSIVQGAAYALLLVGGVAFISARAPKGTAATAQGLFGGVAMSLSSIVGMGLGGPLANAVGIRGLYFVTVAVAAVGVAVIAAATMPGRDAVDAVAAAAVAPIGPADPLAPVP